MVLAAPRLGAVGAWPELVWARQGGVPSGMILSEPVLRSYDMGRTIGVGKSKSDGSKQGKQGKLHNWQSCPACYIAHTAMQQQYCSRHSFQLGTSPFLFHMSQRTPGGLLIYGLHIARKSLLGTVYGSQGHSKSTCHTRCTVDPYTQAGKARTVVVGIHGGY